MATSAQPYGLKPVNLVGGQPYAGSTRQVKIASGYASNIFNGAVVSVVAAGTIEIVSEVGSNSDAFPAGTLGVFVGCAYTDPNTSQKTFRQYWPSGTVASDAVAYVVDDPSVVFQIQADDTLAQSALGTNIPVVNPTAGSTTTGNSTMAADASAIANTDTIAFKIIGFVNSTTSEVGDAYTDILVKFNQKSHAYTSGTGI